MSQTLREVWEQYSTNGWVDTITVISGSNQEEIDKIIDKYGDMTVGNRDAYEDELYACIDADM